MTKKNTLLLNVIDDSFAKKYYKEKKTRIKINLTCLI